MGGDGCSGEEAGSCRTGSRIPVLFCLAVPRSRSDAARERGLSAGGLSLLAAAGVVFGGVAHPRAELALACSRTAGTCSAASRLPISQSSWASPGSGEREEDE